MTATNGSLKLIRGNALDLPLEDESVDLVVTSPPYFGLRSYQDGGEHYEGQIGAEATPAEFVDALLAATREMVRVLKPSGSIWVNLGDKYASGGRGSYDLDPVRRRVAASRPKDGAAPKSLLGLPWRYALRCIDDLGLILRAEVIWSKPNGLPESVKDRVRRSHETWFHFTREPRYFSAVDELREPILDSSEHAASRRNRSDARLTAAKAGATSTANPLGKLPGSVWTIPTQPLRVPDHLGIDHFAAFPMEWPRRIIRGWSPEGGTVLDPFGGTGTTAIVARALGRHGISVDLSADYCRLAEWRANDPKQIKKAKGDNK
jgi:site-specific DNA-methyltransferase (cytosine-N4-specific)